MYSLNPTIMQNNFMLYMKPWWWLRGCWIKSVSLYAVYVTVIGLSQKMEQLQHSLYPL